ncbi:MAG: hypothetical protein ACHP78_16175 [Terriglobales bacterium]
MSSSLMVRWIAFSDGTVSHSVPAHISALIWAALALRTTPVFQFARACSWYRTANILWVSLPSIRSRRYCIGVFTYPSK